jgi:pteridine reductase
MTAAGSAHSLAGKVALVTGAGIRLGRAIAEALSNRGCRLILHCNASRRDAEKLARSIRESGHEAAVLRADLSKGAEVRKLARAAEKVFGGVDILVNNAAVFGPTPLEKLNDAELDFYYAINLKAPYILSAEIGRTMKRRGEAASGSGSGGAILNIACLSGLRPWKTHVPYSISKAGVIALTQGLAKLLAPEVRVNAIAPGTVLPPEGLSEETLSLLRSKIPLKKIGSPSDVVEAALYLLAAPFVTGQILCVDGGRSIH